MAENLSKILKIEDTEYNINAVYSDEAGKVTNQLTVIESTTGNKTTDSSFDFDGSADHAIDYVPADGGKFRGHVRVRDATTEELEDDTTIINSGQVDNRVVDLTGAPLCTWDADNYRIQPVKEVSTDQLYKLTTVVGNTDGFKELNKIFVHDGTSNTASRGLRVSSSTSSSTCKIAGIENTTYTDWNVILPYKAIFRGYPDQSIIYNKAVDGLTDNAFYGTAITGVVIPSNIKTISKTAFKNCTSLTKAVLFKGITTIAEEAFSGCSSLESIVIPATVTSIAKNAFLNCTKLTNVYYGGNIEQWKTISINSTGNTGLTSAAINYEHISAKAEIGIKDSFIYVCKDTETSTAPASNKMFIKLPDVAPVEISKGAARLETPEGAVTSGYYTYETLAAIIKGINSRLEALGSTALTLPETFDTGHIIIPESLPENIINSEKVLVDESIVPTVQDLESAIVKITGDSSYTTAASIKDYSDNLKTIRDDLTELQNCVEFELGGSHDHLGEAIDYSNSRIDLLEAGLASEETARANADKAINERLDEITDTVDSLEFTDASIKLSADIWTDKTIGYVNGTSTAPKKVGSAGDTLKTMFTNIFGTVEDDTSNLVTNPYISSVSIGSSSYEYGTKLDSVSVSITPISGSYKYGPAVTGAGWNGNYTLSGTGFTTKNDSTSNSQIVSLSSTFTVGTSSALTLNASRAYNAATNTAESKKGEATTQTIAAGTATKSGTFNPSAVKYVYWAKSSSTDTPTSWTKYNSGQTSVIDLQLSCAAGEYIWVASTSEYSNLYMFNELSGKYNSNAVATTKISGVTIKNAQNADASGYYVYRTTNARSLATDTKFKLA